MASSGANGSFTEPRPQYNPGENGHLENSQFKCPLRLLLARKTRNTLYEPLTAIITANRINVYSYYDQAPHASDMVMAIYGPPENVSNALLQIMTIVERSRTQNERPGIITMRMVMHKQLMYRKDEEARNNAFREIATKTETAIVVSEYLQEEYDRQKIITIRGYTNSVCRAGVDIKTLTSQCFDLPYSKFTPYYNCEAISHNTDENGYRIISKDSPKYFTINGPIIRCIQDKPRDVFKFFNYNQESVNVLIPLIEIGPLIGPSGDIINEIKRTSGVLGMTFLEPAIENPIARGQICKKLNIIGTFDARLKAQALIFYMMWKSGYGPALEEVILTVEIGCVPYQKIHRILEMENDTKCHIMPFRHAHNIYVRVIGNFYSSEEAQSKIRLILAPYSSY